MVEIQGLEPRMPMAPDLQSGAVTSSARSPIKQLYTLRLCLSTAVQAVRRVCSKMLSIDYIDLSS